MMDAGMLPGLSIVLVQRAALSTLAIRVPHIGWG